MYRSHFDYKIRAVVFGDKSVGKSSFLLRIAENTFTTESTPSVGVDFGSICFSKKNSNEIKSYPDKCIKLQLFDINASTAFLSIHLCKLGKMQLYYVLYDVTNQDSLEKAKVFCKALLRHYDNPLLILVGMKNDLVEQRKVDKEAGQALADEYNIAFFEVSAKNGDHFADLLNTSISQILTRECCPTKKRKPRIESYGLSLD